MAAETDGIDLNDPSAGVLAHFGQEVRLARERMGIQRTEFAKTINFGYALLSKIECGKRVPAREFAEACDAVFPDANGRFMRLWPLALKYAYPAWFRKYVELEQTAIRIYLFNSVLVPGLLQTEEYARAVLSIGRPVNVTDLVTARMERQRVLTRETAPQTWVILEESALRRSTGDPGVMRRQLERIRELAETPPHVIQIIPQERSAFTTPFGILAFPQGPEIAHVDGFPTGYVVADQENVEAARSAFDLLKAVALPPAETASVVDALVKDEYT